MIKQEELQEIRIIFETNRYPPCVVGKVMAQLLSPKPKKHEPKPCPVFLTLPWIGTKPSEQLEVKVKHLVQWAYPMCQAKVCFPSKPMLIAGIKDRIPTHHLSNVIYLFSCRYVGKTTQCLEARMKQHVSAGLARTARITTTAIRDYLLQNAACLDNVDRKMFTIVHRARSESMLHVLEALYIEKFKPDLRKKNGIRKMSVLVSLIC